MKSNSIECDIQNNDDVGGQTASNTVCPFMSKIFSGSLRIFHIIFIRNIVISINIKQKRRAYMTQQELRELYIDRLEREKQVYISKTTGISTSILSNFKNGKLELYPHLFVRLEKYLTNS